MHVEEDCHATAMPSVLGNVFGIVFQVIEKLRDEYLLLLSEPCMQPNYQRASLRTFTLLISF